MKRITVIPLIIIILVGSAYAEGIETISLSMINTGLTLPKSMHQFSILLAYQRSDTEKDVYPGFWYQYGITDTLTLDFIGLKYSLWGSGSPFEVAIRGGVGDLEFGYGSKSGGVLKLRTYNYMECRYRFSQKLYTDYVLYYDRGIYDNDEHNYHEHWIAGVKAAVRYSLTNSFLMAMIGSYNFVEGFKKNQQAEKLGFSLDYGLSSELNCMFTVIEKGLLTKEFTGTNPYNDEIYIGFSIISRKGE